LKRNHASPKDLAKDSTSVKDLKKWLAYWKQSPHYDSRYWYSESARPFHGRKTLRLNNVVPWAANKVQEIKESAATGKGQRAKVFLGLAMK